MDYYDNEANIEEYIKMAKGYDGRQLLPILRKHLKSGSTVLELGMGPGVDLDLLAQEYQVTGSDRSKIFLDRYRRSHPGADLVDLDAVRMEIDRKFDCIYSNKVLHHLTRNELRKSLRKQANTLNADGILFHTFWQGDGELEHSGMRTVYYTESTLKELVGSEYEVVEIGRYAEMDEDDSLYVILKRV